MEGQGGEISRRDVCERALRALEGGGGGGGSPQPRVEHEEVAGVADHPEGPCRKTTPEAAAINELV